MRSVVAVAACVLVVLAAGCQPGARAPDRPAAAAGSPAASGPPAAASAPATPAAAAAPASRKVNVAFVAPTESFVVPWIAKEAGIFARHGLDADVVLVTGSPRLVQSLIAGDFDYALPGVTAILRARIQGADPVILATSTNFSTQALYLPHESSVHALTDLRGKTVGVSQYGSEADSFLRVGLGNVGVNPEDVNILQTGGHPQTLAALLSGSLDAGVLGGAIGLAAEQAGAVRLAGAQDLNVLAPSGTLATTRLLIERDRDGVQRFMHAYVEAIHYFKTDRDDAIRIMQQYMGGLPEDEVALVYDSVRDLYQPLPAPSEAGIQAVLDRETDPAARDFQPSDFVDLSFLQEIEQEGLIQRLYQ